MLDSVSAFREKTAQGFYPTLTRHHGGVFRSTRPLTRNTDLSWAQFAQRRPLGHDCVVGLGAAGPSDRVCPVLKHLWIQLLAQIHDPFLCRVLVQRFALIDHILRLAAQRPHAQVLVTAKSETRFSWGEVVVRVDV